MNDMGDNEMDFDILVALICKSVGVHAARYKWIDGKLID